MMIFPFRSHIKTVSLTHEGRDISAVASKVWHTVCDAYDDRIDSFRTDYLFTTKEILNHILYFFVYLSAINFRF